MHDNVEQTSKHCQRSTIRKFVVLEAIIDIFQLIRCKLHEFKRF